VVIEQFSLLSRSRLEAWTEPNSDIEIGVTVSDHGMYTFCWVRCLPDASVYVTEILSSGALVPVTVYVMNRGPAGGVLAGGGGGAPSAGGGGVSCVTVTVSGGRCRQVGVVGAGDEDRH
jgi:hypothetical protein